MPSPLPPGPKNRAGLSSLRELLRDPPGYLLRAGNTYGDVVHLQFGVFRVYLLNHPDLIKEVLVAQHKNFEKGRALQGAKRLLGQGLLTNEGEAHRRQRRIMQPLFHHQRIQQFARIMAESADEARQSWKPGQVVHMDQEMAHLTLSVTSKALFDTDLQKNPELEQALQDALEVFNEVSLPFAGILGKLPLPRNVRFQKAKRKLDQLIAAMIEERRADPGARADLLSMLLAAQDMEEGTGGMTDQQVRDEAVTVFLAGHDTTAGALMWTWYLLSQHPQVDQRFRAEVRDVLQGRLPGVEDVPKLRYTRAVLSESMRLYPPAWVLGRRALQATRVGGYDVPRGTIILLSQYVTHHNAKYWPDPERFDPERWLQEDDERPRYAYFPFGGGPRVCIGEPFAWMEAIIVLATLAQRWRFTVAQPGFQVELQPTLTLKSRHGMPMRVEAA
jgi:cytochrome P450